MKLPEKVWVVFGASKPYKGEYLAGDTVVCASAKVADGQRRWFDKHGCREAQAVCYIRLPEQERERT